VSDLRAGLRVSVASIVWTVLASTASIGLGIRSGSLVLVAFGAVGVFDAVGSAVLVTHFRHALRHDVISVRRERLAQLVVAIGLLIVGTATVAAGIARLVRQDHSHESVAGLAVAGCSIVVLACLGIQKRRLGLRIPSRALRADGGLSLVGAATAAAAVAGTALNDALSWWWSDPVAACVIALGAMGLSVATLRTTDEAPR
jgi:divalent metal cation (Fe/Co/Zn/Cd) transporter